MSAPLPRVEQLTADQADALTRHQLEEARRTGRLAEHLGGTAPVVDADHPDARPITTREELAELTHRQVDAYRRAGLLDGLMGTPGR